MSKPVLHGPGFSTYVRSCRIALAEKGVAYEHHDFNFLEGWPEGYEELHPFRKVPAFEHDGLRLFETVAILVYVDAAFDGPSLVPADAEARARCFQALGVVDSYAYNALITRTFIPRAVVPLLGGTTDESVIEGARADAERAVAVLDRLLQGREYFAGPAPSLADFHAVPVLHYAGQIPEGQAMLAKAPALGAWTKRMSGRESVSSTVPSLG